jgi:hypothetical protein
MVVGTSSLDECDGIIIYCGFCQGGMAFHFHVFVIGVDTIMHKSFLCRFLASLMPDEMDHLLPVFLSSHKLSEYFILIVV